MSINDAMARQCREEYLADVEAERDAAAARLSNLLAVIHGDSGHYEIQSGVAKASRDAESLVVELRADRVEAARLGYMAGHDDTVEGRYGDPLEVAVDLCAERWEVES